MSQGLVGEMEGLRLTAEPFRRFMAANVRGADLQLFLDLANMPAVPAPD
jgi:flagellar biosynthetic protein FliP